MALGPVALAKNVPDAAGKRRYCLLSLEDMSQVFRLAYGSMPASEIERRCRGVARVTELLVVNEDALAGIYAVLMAFPDIALDGMAKLAAVASLRKYNPNWEDEPRIPAGNPGVGEWTNDGSTGVTHDKNPAFHADPAFLPVAYQGTYHDQVVVQIAAHWRREGAKVVTAIRLTAKNGSTARADLIAILTPGDQPVLAEVKTGADPQYTDNQRVLYPMAQVGNHVYSPDQKIIDLGFSPGQWLPPMQFVTIYKKDAQSPYVVIHHEHPIIP